MNSSSDKNDNSTTVNQNSLAIQNFPIGLQKYYLDQIVEGSTEKREYFIRYPWCLVMGQADQIVVHDNIH